MKNLHMKILENGYYRVEDEKIVNAMGDIVEQERFVEEANDAAAKAVKNANLIADLQENLKNCKAAVTRACIKLQKQYLYLEDIEEIRNELNNASKE